MENTKKNNIWLLSLGAISLALTPLFLTLSAFQANVYDETYLAELKDKCARLDSLTSPKLVLLGGSGVAFSLNAKLLESAFPRFQSVNFGLYAGLGSLTMLELAKPALGKGDVVVFSPEQNEQSLSDYFNPRYAYEALEGKLNYANRLDEKKRQAMQGYFLDAASEKFAYQKAGKTAESNGVYAHSSFNAWGDIESTIPSGNALAGLYDPTMSITFSGEEMAASFLSSLNEIAKDYQSRGIAFYYRFPAMNAMAVEDPEDLDDYYDALQRQLAFPLLGNPHECVMNPLYFYDTNFHLNQSGQIVNTVSLIKDLKAVWGDTTPTEVTLPSTPAPLVNEVREGNDQDRAYFTYEEKDAGYQITGVTAEGKTKQILILPSTYQGKGVLSFAASTFQNNGVLQEITLGNNIRSLLDNSFAGTSSLAKIHLPSLTPASYSVGLHLLEGTSANLFVPSTSVSRYKTDYSFSHYADRIFAEN